MDKSLFEQIQELALEKCAGDQEQADAFTEAFIKQAFNWGGMAADISKGAGSAIGGSIAGLGLGLGIHGISSALRSAADSNLRSKFESALKMALSSNEMLRHAMSENPQRVRSFADTIFSFAPHVACDPNILAHLLVNSVQGESVDITTIKTITELENRYSENRRNSLFSPKTYVK